MAKLSQRYYPTHLEAIAEALTAIFQTGSYADRVLEQILRADPRRGSRDRSFIAENVYEIVRWYRLLTTIMGYEPQQSADWWQLFAIRQVIIGEELPAWREFAEVDAAAIRQAHATLQAQRPIRESIPDWLDELAYAQLGDTWSPTLAALNQPASAVLRTNVLKTAPQELQAQLAQDGILTTHIGAAALRVTARKNLFRTPAFQRGLFEMQDYSSQQVAPLLDPQPGMTTIDACAGAGGKTLHLATLMQNKGRIIALDTEAWKLTELRKRARRGGIHIIDTRPITSTKTIKRLREQADRLLLDVPCSGLGVLRRNPDAKWKLSPEFIARLQQLQADILSRYPIMLRSGGRMLYATCSVLPSENGEQVARFLGSTAGQGFSLVEERTILPQDEGYDGFYLALIQKK